MNRKRAKWLSRQIAQGNSVILMTIRNYCGTKTQHMNPRQVYRVAKRLWKTHAEGTEDWLKSTQK